MQKSVLLTAIQKEIQRHDLSYFVSDPPSVAQGGSGAVVAQFMDHLTKDVIPELIEHLATKLATRDVTIAPE